MSVDFTDSPTHDNRSSRVAVQQLLVGTIRLRIGTILDPEHLIPIQVMTRMAAHEKYEGETRQRTARKAMSPRPYPYLHPQPQTQNRDRRY